MKNVLLLILVFAVFTPVFSQSLVIDNIRPLQWKKYSTVTGENDHFEIKLMALAEREKGSKLKVKQLRIDDQKYRLIRSQNAINIQSEDKANVLKTNSNRSKAFLADGTSYTIKNKNFLVDGKFEYFDQNDQLVLRVKYNMRHFQSDVITIEIHDNKAPGIKLIAALGLEEMIRFGYRMYLPI